MSTNIFPEHDFQTKCICFPGAFKCKCSADERALRNYATGENLGAMSEPQRAWCYKQIRQYSEASWEEGELEAYNDQTLAREVLEAWSMYVRDKMGF